MPGPARPFVAVKAFSCLNQHYKAGDVVDHPVVLSTVARYGDTFVKAEPSTKTTTKTKEA